MLPDCSTLGLGHEPGLRPPAAGNEAMSHRIRLLILFGLGFGGFAQGSSQAFGAAAIAPAAKWIADEADNICGIKDLKKVSNPAQVDYDDLWDSTPQIKKMKEKKIDPDSPEGKALRNQAKTLITKTCELVRAAKKHCGIWKSIKNEDGRTVPDVTADVKSKFDD
jgi:hypothetical protein